MSEYKKWCVLFVVIRVVEIVSRSNILLCNSSVFNVGFLYRVFIVYMCIFLKYCSRLFILNFLFWELFIEFISCCGGEMGKCYNIWFILLSFVGMLM